MKLESKVSSLVEKVVQLTTVMEVQAVNLINSESEKKLLKERLDFMMREEEEEGRRNNVHVVELEVEIKNLKLNLDITIEKLNILHNAKQDLDSTVSSLNRDLVAATEEKNQLCVELAYMRENVTGFRNIFS